MPRYFYKCSVCDVELDVWHPISERLTDCEFCGSLNSLEKMPTGFTTLKKTEQSSKVGDITKEAIEEFGEELKEQKKKLQNIEYDDS